MKILVTGGLGFIGSHIAKALSKVGHQVSISDYPTIQNICNIHTIAYHLLHPDEILASLEGYEAVVHMGAISNTIETDGELIFKNNIKLSLDIGRKCKESGIKLIYASSASIYGDGKQGFYDHEEVRNHIMYRPGNLYAWSKHYVDMQFMLEGYFNCHQTFCGLRFFNVYGKNEASKGTMASVLSQNLENIRHGRVVRLFRNNTEPSLPKEARRDFVSVELAVDMAIESLANDITGIYNVGTGTALSFSEHISAAFECAGQTPNIEFIDIPRTLLPRYQFFTEAEMSKSRSVFNACRLLDPLHHLKSYIEQEA